MDAFRPDTAAEYRQQAEKIRTLAEQVSLLEAKFHLFEAAQHLEELAGEDRQYAAAREYRIARSMERG
jgi:hypothetical protein